VEVLWKSDFHSTGACNLPAKKVRQFVLMSLIRSVMRAHYFAILISIFAVPFFVNAATAVGPLISENTVWTAEGSPYLPTIPLTISEGVELVIQDGVVVKFHIGGYIIVHGSLRANGDTQGIIFTSILDDLVGGDTNGDGAATVPERRDWIQITTSPTGTISMTNTEIRYGGRAWNQFTPIFPSLINQEGVMVLDSVSLHESEDGIYINGGTTTIINSHIYDNRQGGIDLVSADNAIFNFTNNSVENSGFLFSFRSGVSTEPINAENNWWGDPSGPWHETQNPNGLGGRILGNVDFTPWLGAPPNSEAPPAECCSSVVFLPGLQASRLYLQETSENKLWEPNNTADVQKLYLNEDGDPLNSGIYTKDTIDEVFGVNVYKKFKEFMNGLTENPDPVIAEWREFPYDWRKPVDEVAEFGTLVKEGDDFNILDIADEIVAMAESSPTRKVTILAHSNGGLLGKLLISELQNRGEDNLVDKFIMVAVPQLGTPKALASLLHGDEQLIPAKLGFIMDRSEARRLAENMPSAYALLPSPKYFDEVLDPVIEFNPEVTNIYDFFSFYGDSVDSREELLRFLLGEDGGRAKPSVSDTDSPNVLNSLLLGEASGLQDTLDSWIPPAGIEVTQIVGWGLDTIRAIRYDNCDTPLCPNDLNNLDRELVMVHDGDGTVVVPSAEFLQQEQKYYLNLKEHNEELIVGLRRNRDHADILEADPLQEFIRNILENDIAILPNHISEVKPTPKDADKRLRYRIHSPVSLDLYDLDGNHTGPVENLTSDSDFRWVEANIPNSYYLEFGEVKYAGSGSGSPIQVVLVGQGTGTFTLEVEELSGEDNVVIQSFSGIPVIKDAKATLEVENLSSPLTLAMDMDNDGVIDAVIESGEGLTAEELLKILRGVAQTLNLPDKNKKRFNKIFDKIEKNLAKEKGCTDKKKPAKCEYKVKQSLDKTMNKLALLIEKFFKKGLISLEEKEEFLQIMNSIS